MPSAVLELCQRLQDTGHGAWLVGGCVRDSLWAQLSGPAAPGSWRAKDWDLATDATPNQVTRLFRRVIPTGVEHGTVTVLLGDLHIEVTTLRTEVGYSDGRRPEQVDFVSSIEEDLARRDFTVNAIAFDPRHEALVDPFHGLEDLHARRLRAVGDPSRRFAEDGLRVLRAARFVAALEFELEPATAAAIRPSLDTYRQVSAERIHDEWNKALRAREPSRAFRVMYEHGLLDITAPELAALATRPTVQSHELAVALRRVDLCPPEIGLRLAALLRCLHETPDASAGGADAVLERLRYSNVERKTVMRLVRGQNLPLDSLSTGAEVRRWLRNVGPDLYRELCTLERADLASRAQDSLDPALVTQRRAAVEELEQRAAAELAKRPPLALGDLAVDGKQLMAELGLRPGPQLGKLLAALLEQVLEEPELNTKAALIERARSLSS